MGPANSARSWGPAPGPGGTGCPPCRCGAERRLQWTRGSLSRRLPAGSACDKVEGRGFSIRAGWDSRPWAVLESGGIAVAWLHVLAFASVLVGQSQAAAGSTAGDAKPSGSAVTAAPERKPAGSPAKTPEKTPT